MVAWEANHDPLILCQVHVKNCRSYRQPTLNLKGWEKVCCPPSHSNSSHPTQVELLKLYNTAVWAPIKSRTSKQTNCLSQTPCFCFKVFHNPQLHIRRPWSIFQLLPRWCFWIENLASTTIFDDGWSCAGRWKPYYLIAERLRSEYHHPSSENMGPSFGIRYLAPLLSTRLADVHNVRVFLV